MNTFNINGPCDTTTTSAFNQWNYPERVEVNEFLSRIEMIYKQTSIVTLTTYPAPPPPAQRTYKIIFSCKDKKWHKSEPIFGKIIPSQPERYEFDESDV